MRRQSAIVRGAVLHRKELKLVTDRIMRRHYGIEKAVPFESGVHPPARLLVTPDGSLRCQGVMHWDVIKVLLIWKKD
jgi:hypothetical protein